MKDKRDVKIKVIKIRWLSFDSRKFNEGRDINLKCMRVNKCWYLLAFTSYKLTSRTVGLGVIVSL